MQSIREIYTPADKWNLASDQLLISMIQQFSTNLFSMSNQVSSSLDRVVSSISTAKIKMKNISIRLTNAAEDQYLENRVEKPPQIQDEMMYKTRRKNRNHRVRQLIMEESQVENTQIGRMRMAVQMAIEKLSFKQNEDMVSMGESDSISKHASNVHQNNRSTFQLRLPPCIGDSKFSNSKYLGLAVENLDAIEEEEEDDSMSRNSEVVYRSGGSVIHLPPENNPTGTVSAIPSLNSVPVGSAVSAIPMPNSGASAIPPPPPPPPPPGMDAPVLQSALTMSDELARFRPRQQSETSMIGEQISRDPSFMMDTPRPADLAQDVNNLYKSGTFGNSDNRLQDQQKKQEEIPAASQPPVKLSKKEQKKKQKQQKQRIKQQKKRLKKQNSKSKTSKSVAPSNGSAIPKTSKTSLPPPPPPPPPPPAATARPTSQTIKQVKKGKTLTIQDQLAMRKSSPAQYATTSTKSVKKKTQESFLPMPPQNLNKKDSVISMKGSHISNNFSEQPLDTSIISVGMPFQRSEEQKQDQQLPAFGGGGGGGGFLAELKKNLGNQQKQSNVKNDSDDSSSSSSSDGKQSQSQDDDQQQRVAQQTNIRAPSMSNKQEQSRNYSQVSNRAPSQRQSIKKPDFKDNLARILQSQQAGDKQNRKVSFAQQQAQPQTEQNNNQRHQASAPTASVSSSQSDWRQSKRQLSDLFGAEQNEGGGFLTNDTKKKTDTFGGGGVGMFDFQGVQQEQTQQQQSSKLKNTKKSTANLNQIFQNEDDEDESQDIYKEQKNSEIYKYSNIAQGNNKTKPPSQIISKQSVLNSMKSKNSRQGSLFEQEQTPLKGKGVGKIGQDQDKVFNQSKNSFWWQDQVQKQNESVKNQPKITKKQNAPNLFQTDLDQTQSVASSIMARQNGNNNNNVVETKNKGPNRMPSLFNDQSVMGNSNNPSIISNPSPIQQDDQYEEEPQMKKQDFKSKIQATLKAQMIGAPPPSQMMGNSNRRNEEQHQQEEDQINIMMSKPTRKQKNNVRLPSEMMFDESDAQKQRNQNQYMQQKPPKTVNKKQVSMFEDFQQEQEKVSVFQSKKPFKKSNNPQLFDSFNSIASKQVPQQDTFQQQQLQQNQFSDPFGISKPATTAQKKPSKNSSKKPKFFFDQTDNQSMDESVKDYYQPPKSKKQVPPAKNSMFTQDQALQQRAAQSNINLFADSFVSEAPTEQFMLPSQKKQVDKKGKKKNAKMGGGFDLFGGGRDDDDNAISVSKKQQQPQKPAQTQKAVAKRLQNLFDDDFDDEY